MSKSNKEFKNIPDNLDNIERQRGVIGAYVITDKETDQTYVGSTNDLVDRKNVHERLLNNNKHHNKNLQKAFNNGAQLEFTGTPLSDRETAYDFEQSVINDFYNSGLLFNRAINARDGYNGLPLTDETREKMRQAQLGKKHTPEHIEKTRQANLGKKRSEEFKEKMRVSQTGREITEETRQKLRDSHLGYVMPEEQKDKIRQANTGREVTDEHRKNLSIALTGKTHSEETKQKLRELSTGRTHTEESKQKMREASTGRVIPREAVERSRLARIGAKRTPEQVENLKNSPASLGRAKAVIVNGKEYFSKGEAARQNNVAFTTVSTRINSPSFPEWRYK